MNLVKLPQSRLSEVASSAPASCAHAPTRLAGGGKAWFVGIDPGKQGAVAAVNDYTGDALVWKMPLLAEQIDIQAFHDILKSLLADGGIGMAILEKAQVMPKQGAVSGFTTGRNYGVLLATMSLVGVRFEEIRPAEWKRHLIGGAAKGARKAKSGDATVVAETPGSLDPLSTDSLLAEAPESAMSKKKAGAAQKKLIKEVAIAAARKLFPAAHFRDTQDGIAEALLMAEAARRLHVNGSMAVSTQTQSNHQVTPDRALA